MRFLTRIPWLLLALLALTAALCLRPVSDTDILWHLRAGQWMLAHDALLRADDFSITRWGRDWVSVPWLHEVILFWLRDACGWLGPTLWQMAFALAIVLQSAWLTWLFRRPHSRWEWRWPALSAPAALALLLMLRILQMRINCRPEMNSYLLIGSFLIILTQTQRAAAAAGRAPRLLWLLPALQIWWVNTHGMFILGPLLAGAYATAAWLEALRVRLAPPAAGAGARVKPAVFTALQFTLATTLTGLACLVTPYGLAGALYPLHLFDVLTDPLYRDTIVEGWPVPFKAVLTASGAFGMALLVGWVFSALGLLGRLLEGATTRDATATNAARSPGALVWRFWRAAEELSGGYIICCAALAYLSLTAIRNVPLLLLATAPLAANGIEYAADGLAAVAGGLWARLRRRDPRAAALAGVALLHGRAVRLTGRGLLLLGLACCYRAVVSERFYDAIGWRTRCAIGFSDHEQPLAACHFLRQHLATLGPQVVAGNTRGVNTLLWAFGPAWKTYFDGRHAEIYDPPIYRSAMRALGAAADFENEAALYGIGVVCMALSDKPDGPSPFTRELYAATNAWRLAYLDDCAALFVARGRAPDAWLERFALAAPPPGAAAQRAVFAGWLRAQGRARLEDLDDPGNAAFSTNAWARGLLRCAQAGGLWAPTRQLQPLRYCRLAAFLDGLGWHVVADDFYEAAARAAARADDPYVLACAVEHAIALHRGSGDDDALRAATLARLRQRVARLARVAPGTAAARALAYLDLAEGHPAAAAARAARVLARGPNLLAWHVLIDAEMALGDAAAPAAAREEHWRRAVLACRARLAFEAHDVDAWLVYARLADLATRLAEPEVARVNARLALANTNTPPVSAAWLRRQYGL